MFVLLQNASTNTTAQVPPSPDDCNITNKMTYEIFSYVIMGEFLLALPLNLSILYVFLFRFKFWKTNSIFLFNIVVADLLLLICLPFKAYHFQRGERHSENKVVCKAMLFMQFLNRGASIAFLTVTSIDRYFNVVHGGRNNFLRALKKSPQISILIWMLLLPLTIPTMLKTFECCNSYGRNSHDITDTMREVVFFTQILVPFSVLVYCTVRIVKRLNRKTVGDRTKLRRAVFLVTSVMMVFSICFLPCTLSRMVLLIVRVKDLPAAEEITVQVYDGLMVMSYMDCLVDPVVYCFCYSGFKNVYMSTFCPFLLKRRRCSDPSTDEQRMTSQSPSQVKTV